MTYPVGVETFSDLVKVARRVIDRQSGSMTEDAIVLARWILAEDERRACIPFAPINVVGHLTREKKRDLYRLGAEVPEVSGGDGSDDE
jgi:hypothetical protein